MKRDEDQNKTAGSSTAELQMNAMSGSRGVEVIVTADARVSPALRVGRSQDFS